MKGVGSRTDGRRVCDSGCGAVLVICMALRGEEAFCPVGRGLWF